MDRSTWSDAVCHSNMPCPRWANCVALHWSSSPRKDVLDAWHTNNGTVFPCADFATWRFRHLGSLRGPTRLQMDIEFENNISSSFERSMLTIEQKYFHVALFVVWYFLRLISHRLFFWSCAHCFVDFLKLFLAKNWKTTNTDIRNIFISKYAEDVKQTYIVSRFGAQLLVVKTSQVACYHRLRYHTVGARGRTKQWVLLLTFDVRLTSTRMLLFWCS